MFIHWVLAFWWVVADIALVALFGACLVGIWLATQALVQGVPRYGPDPDGYNRRQVGTTHLSPGRYVLTVLSLAALATVVAASFTTWGSQLGRWHAEYECQGRTWAYENGINSPKIIVSQHWTNGRCVETPVKE